MKCQGCGSGSGQIRNYLQLRIRTFPTNKYKAANMYKFKKLRCLDYLQFICIFHQQSKSKNVQIFKNLLFCDGLDDLQICSSNVFFINNPYPKLRWKPDQDTDPEKNNFGSTIHNTVKCGARLCKWPSHSLRTFLAFSSARLFSLLIYRYLTHDRTDKSFIHLIFSNYQFSSARLSYLHPPKISDP